MIEGPKPPKSLIWTKKAVMPGQIRTAIVNFWFLTRTFWYVTYPVVANCPIEEDECRMNAGHVNPQPTNLTIVKA